MSRLILNSSSSTPTDSTQLGPEERGKRNQLRHQVEIDRITIEDDEEDGVEGGESEQGDFSSDEEETKIEPEAASNRNSDVDVDVHTHAIADANADADADPEAQISADLNDGGETALNIHPTEVELSYSTYSSAGTKKDQPIEIVFDSEEELEEKMEIDEEEGEEEDNEITNSDKAIPIPSSSSSTSSLSGSDPSSSSSAAAFSSSSIAAATSTTAAAAPSSVSISSSLPSTPLARYTFADLSTPSQRYLTLMSGCPPQRILYKLIRLVCRPEGEEHLLRRDPMMVAKLFPSNSNSTVRTSRNLRLCMDYLKSFMAMSCAASFSVKLSNAQLEKYQTNLTFYLQRTNGVPPIDLSTMIGKLQNSRPNDDTHFTPTIDEEGFQCAYPNDVGCVIKDLVNIIINACKFNPPTHPVHRDAIEFAEKVLQMRYLPRLRQSLEIEKDLEVCLLCGDGTSDEYLDCGLLIQCESCSMWYHQACVELAHVPKDPYWCDSCVDEDPKLKRAKKKPFIPKIAHDRLTQSTTHMVADSSTTHAASAGSSSPTSIADDPSSSSASTTGKRRDRSTPTGQTSESIKRMKHEHTNSSTTSTPPIYSNQNASPPSSIPLSSPSSSISSSVPASAPSASNPLLIKFPNFSPDPPVPRSRTRALSPDGSWLRAMDFKIQERGNRGVAQLSSSSSDIIGPDEPELRSLRCDIDTVMRLLAVTQERMRDLQRRQRTRALKEDGKKKSIDETMEACKQVVHLLMKPIEPLDATETTSFKADAEQIDASMERELDELVNHTDGNHPTDSSSSRSLSILLSKYRRVHLARSRYLSQQREHLLNVEAQLSQSRSRIEELEVELDSDSKLTRHRILELERALNEAQTKLRDERAERNRAIEKRNSQAQIIEHIVQTANKWTNTLRRPMQSNGLPSSIPNEFGTWLLKNAHAAVHQQASKNQTSSTKSNQSNQQQQQHQLSHLYTPLTSTPASSTTAVDGLFNFSYQSPSTSASQHSLLSDILAPTPAQLSSSIPYQLPGGSNSKSTQMNRDETNSSTPSVTNFAQSSSGVNIQQPSLQQPTRQQSPIQPSHLRNFSSNTIDRTHDARMQGIPPSSVESNSSSQQRRPLISAPSSTSSIATADTNTVNGKGLTSASSLLSPSSSSSSPASALSTSLALQQAMYHAYSGWLSTREPSLTERIRTLDAQLCAIPGASLNYRTMHDFIQQCQPFSGELVAAMKVKENAPSSSISIPFERNQSLSSSSSSVTNKSRPPATSTSTIRYDATVPSNHFSTSKNISSTSFVPPTSARPSNSFPLNSQIPLLSSSTAPISLQPIVSSTSLNSPLPVPLPLTLQNPFDSIVMSASVAVSPSSNRLTHDKEILLDTQTQRNTTTVPAGQQSDERGCFTTKAAISLDGNDKDKSTSALVSTPSSPSNSTQDLPPLIPIT